ncbi:MAG: TonB-dependent receptor plug domain-containing protein [Muribaculaceae bacterium]
MKIRIKTFLCFILLCPFYIDAETGNNDTTYIRELKEVVVKSSRPVSKFSADGIITDIAGTALQNLGTARDVIGFLPGVVSINGNIEVVGKGAPTIYINGRKMRNSTELDQLSPNRIKNITIIRDPGARYGSNVNSVIRITTVREQGEGFSLNSKSTIGVKDYYYGNELLWMNYRKDRFDFFSTINYNYSKAKGNSYNYQNTWGTKLISNEILLDAKSRTQSIEGQIGTNYTLDNGSVGIYYQVNHKPTRKNIDCNSTQWIDGTLSDNSSPTEYIKDNNIGHLVDAYYSAQIGKWSIEWTADYLWRKNTEHQDINYISSKAQIEPIFMYDKNHGKMFATELHLSRRINKGTINFGAEYTNSKRDDDFTGDRHSIPDDINEIKEDGTAAYIETTQRLGKVSLQVGIRYEHILNCYIQHTDLEEIIERKYDKLLPTASFVIPLKSTAIQLSYSRKFSRPVYSQLSSTVTYVNQYIYETGNPLLKTPTIDNVSINMRYKWFMILATYKHVDNPIITTCDTYSGNENITLFKKDNSARDLHNFQLLFNIAPGFIKKIYYPVFMFGTMSQIYKADYLGSAKNMTRPIGIVRFNNIFKLPQNYVVTANFSWRGKGDSENIRLKQTWQFDLSLKKYK